MARCEDCIHKIVCSALIEKGLPWDDGVYPAEAFCVAFRNKADVAPKSEVARLEQEIKALLAFKEYFSDLYGNGLEVANWHENGALEPFDNFYESAEDEYEAELKKKYTEPDAE